MVLGFEVLEKGDNKAGSGLLKRPQSISAELTET